MAKKKSTVLAPVSIKAALQQMRTLIADGWIQGAYAAKADGEYVDSLNAKATHYCVVGAMNRVTKRDGILNNILYQRVLKAAEESPNLFFGGLTTFNDMTGQTQAGVLAVLDKAIDACV